MRTVHTIALACLIAAEMALFLVVTKHHYAWSYPRWSDQTQYLGQAYGTYETARADGYGAAVWNDLKQVCAQGCLHEILALPVFAAVGPSRTAALAVNMVAFAALQLATFLAVRRISKSYSIAWASVGLLLSLQYPWSGIAGSAVDFRLDWMSACAYGVALAVALAGREFRSTGWAALFGATVGVTILMRYLMVVYFALIFVALLVWLLMQRGRWARCARLCLAGLVAFGVFGPAFWHSRMAIYNYYWVDHFTGAGRALHGSHFGAFESARWIVTQVVYYKVGLRAFGLGSLAAVLLLASASRSKSNAVRPQGADAPVAGGLWVMALAFLCAPAVVLAAHPIKDQPPASVLIPGGAWIIFVVWSQLAPRAKRSVETCVGVGVLAAGMLVFVRAEASTPYVDHEAATYRAINGLEDYLFFKSETDGLTHPRVAVTWLLDGVYAETFRVLAYERHQRMLGFAATLPTGLTAPTRELAMKALSDSDFVCLTTRAAVRWPFDRQMQEIMPAMREWCESHMTYVGSVVTERFSLSVYERSVYGVTPGVKNGDLASLLGAAQFGVAYREATVPAAPIFTTQAIAVASSEDFFRFQPLAAFSPVHYRAASLPEGLAMSPTTGEISGRLPHAGNYGAQISATNSVGTTTGKLEIHVENGPWFAFMSAPQICRSGVPFDVKFGAYDAGCHLDFIDVTDLTARQTLKRLEATNEQHHSWAGFHRLVISQPGPRIILMRFVRYDPDAKVPYTFIDHQCGVDVSP